jgi:plasmid segregation protein ParM
LQFGQEIDISEEVAKAVSHCCQKINAKADSSCPPDVRKLHGVILAGGGAPVAHEKSRRSDRTAFSLTTPHVSSQYGRYGMGVALRVSVKRQSQRKP